MSKLRHALVTAAAIVAAAVPALAADPAVRSLIAHHPAVAAYFPLASALIVALFRAVASPKSKTSATATGPADVGRH